jgi:protein phosphatase
MLADAVRAACAAIFEAAQDDPELQGMGTTLTSLLVQSDRAFVAHVGDSRCYLQRSDRIVQITDDHSLVNEQVKAGLITREQGRQSRLKNIITRSVGFERDVAVDTFALPLQAGDKLLMCSDGLANFVDDTEIGLALATLPIDEVPVRMVELANERGGDDNITVVCLTADEA